MPYPNAEQEFFEALTHIGRGGDVITALRSRCGNLPPLQEAAVNKIVTMLEEREPSPAVESLEDKVEQLENDIVNYKELLSDIHRLTKEKVS